MTVNRTSFLLALSAVVSLLVGCGGGARQVDTAASAAIVDGGSPSAPVTGAGDPGTQAAAGAASPATPAAGSVPAPTAIQTDPTPGAPAISAISPAAGPESGGTRVVISGSNLDAAQVLFGTRLATIAEPPTDTTVVVLTPKQNPGVVGVVVTNRNGTYAVRNGGFTYTP